MIVPSSLFAFYALLGCTEVSSFDVKSWQSTSSSGFTFPEDSLSEVQASKSVGLTFSGGGDRSYLASIGYLAAMHELGLLEDVKYIVGVSGGAWATSVYSFYNNDAVSDSKMLGPIVMPEDIVYDRLKIMDPDCVRKYTNSNFPTRNLGPSYDDYKNGIDNIYLDPAGIKRGAPFSYNDNTVADIKTRNPDLQHVQFNTVRGRSAPVAGVDKRPYPIISTTLMSPRSLLPTMPSNRIWDLLEFTPLGTGVAFTEEVTYTTVDNSKSLSLNVGGYIEPFAFGMEAPASGLSSEETSGSLHLGGSSSTIVHGDLLEAATSSSWAVGMTLSTSDRESFQAMNGFVPYWSPSSSDPQADMQEFVFADGAGVSNTNIISLLQRKVHRIVAVVNSNTPLQSSDNWDPSSGTLSKEDIDFTVPAWFGHIATDLNDIDKSAFDLENSQFFPESDYVPFVQGLQAAQQVGKGNIYVHKHTTVANVKYGIVAGQEVEMVWVYHGRCFEWESRLSRDMYNRVTPRLNKEDPANLVSSGEFQDFPHYSTGVNGINFEQANLLADLTGWIVHENRKMLSSFMHDEAMDFNDVSSDSGSGNSNDSTSKWVIGVVSGVCVSLLVGVGLVMYKRHQDSDLLLDDALPSCVADSGRGVSDYAIFSSTRGGDASYRPVEDSSSVESVLSEL